MVSFSLRDLRRTLIVLSLLGIGVAGGLWIGAHSNPPRDRTLLIRARQYAYDPSVIHANRGDTLHIKLASLDVVHGFFLEGYDLDGEIYPQRKTFLIRHPSRPGPWQEVEEVTVRLDRPGKFRYRCSHTCGTMHPFMMGELIVAPNLPLRAGLGGTIGLLVGMTLVGLLRIRGTEHTEEKNAAIV